MRLDVTMDEAVLSEVICAGAAPSWSPKQHAARERIIGLPAAAVRVCRLGGNSLKRRPWAPERERRVPWMDVTAAVSAWEALASPDSARRRLAAAADGTRRAHVTNLVISLLRHLRATRSHVTYPKA